MRARWAVPLMLAALVVVTAARAASLPAVKRLTYRDADGEEHVYLVQRPSAKIVGLFVYVHGAGGFEEQGMDPKGYQGSFGRLRELLAREGWIYACPRTPDFASFAGELGSRFGKLRTVLAGASAGGRRVWAELARAPGAYAGTVLLCPAVAEPDDGEWGAPDLPAWIVSGAEDVRITRSARGIAAAMKKAGRRVKYTEIAGGNHDAPVKQVDWAAALEFVTR